MLRRTFSQGILAGVAALWGLVASVRGDDGSFRYATWNIGHFALGKASASAISSADAEEKKAAYADFLDEVNADWLGICEFSERFTSDGAVSAADAVFGRYPQRSVGPQESYQWNAAFAREAFEIVETVTNHYPDHVQNVYYLAHRVRLGDALEAWFVQTHLDWAAGGYRSNQVARLIADFADKPRVVISGDFNFSGQAVDGSRTTDWSYTDLLQRAGYHTLNTGVFGTTCSGMVLDNVYVRGFTIADAAVHPHRGLSDHDAVSCRLVPLDADAVNIPAPPPAVFYDGTVRLPSVTVDAGYTVAWDVAAPVEAGTYSGTATLADPARTRWTDGTTSPKPLSFTIRRTPNAWRQSPSLSSNRWAVADGAAAVTVGDASFGVPVANYTQAQLAALPAGRFVYRTTVDTTDNYEGLTNEIPFTVFVPLTATLSYDGARATGARLTFAAESVPRGLWVAYGDADLGETAEGWAGLKRLATIPAGSGSVEVSLPSALGKTYGTFRFVLRTDIGADVYVQDGLIAQWDARENAGRGLHEDTPSVWKDLAGSHDIAAQDLAFSASDVMLPTGVTVTVPLADTLPASVSKTVEGVFRTDDTFDFGNPARMDFVNAGNDGSISFRNHEFRLVGIFVNRENRCAYYTKDETSGYSTAARLRSCASYSGVFAPRATESSLWVNGDVFTMGLKTADGAGNYYWSAASGFDHRDDLRLANLSRANAFYASVRVYNRALTDAERTANAEVDRIRFLGGDELLQVSSAYTVPVAFTATIKRTAGTADFSFAVSRVARRLLVAWGGVGDRGAATNEWAHLEQLAEVARGVRSLKGVALPKDALQTSGVRFFLEDVYASDDYVQDGLVVHWDARDNAGLGTHDAAAAVWTDLAGGHGLALDAGAGVRVEEGFVFLPSGVRLEVAVGGLARTDPKTIEAVGWSDEKTYDFGSSGRVDILNACNDAAISFKGADTTYVSAIFVDKAGTARYDTGLDLTVNRKETVLMPTSYSLVNMPEPQASAYSSLFVNGMPYITRGSGADAETTRNFYTASFSHTENVQVGFNRANLYLACGRVYNRALTDAERAWNAKIDRVRFCGDAAPLDVTDFIPVRQGTYLILR